MKKSLAMLLIISTLCLTSCNNAPAETSNFTNQTEDTSMFQTDEHNQTLQTNYMTDSTTNKIEETIEVNGYIVPEKLRDKIIFSQMGAFLDFSSRIVFAQSGKDELIGNTYQNSGNGNILVYYSKADGETYVNCFDPLCDHKDCAVTKFGIDARYCTTYNNRFYHFDKLVGAIYSFSFDGSDVKKEYQMFEQVINGTSPFKKLNSYDCYWFIAYVHEDGSLHCLRFNMATGEIVDLTEQTGNYLAPAFFYNGEMYGTIDDGTIKKADLSLTKIEDTDIVFKDNFLFTQTIGNQFFGYIKEWTEDEFGNQKLIYKGIYTYNIETGEETFISSETIGKNVVYPLYADENYVYFTSDDEPTYIGKNRYQRDVYNKGKIWRINRDGTNCICVFDNPNINIYDNYPLMIYQNKIFIYASEVGMAGGIAQSWNEGMYIGTIQADGTIDKLEYIEVIE